MSNSQKQKLCKKLITLTTEELERARKISVFNPTSKTSQKTPFARKVFTSVHKYSVHCTPNRARSQQRKFDELLKEKLMQKFQSKKMIPLRNYMSVMDKYTKKSRSSGSKKKREKQSASVLRSEVTIKRPYYADISLNLSKLLRRKSSQSPSISWTEGRRKSKRMPKSVAKHIDDKELVITANSSYIGNFNVSPGMLFYSNHSKGYPSGSHAESFITNKDLGKSSKAIEAKLEKRLSAINSSVNYEKSFKALNAHKEAFANVIALDPYFGSLLERIKNSYEDFIEVLMKKQKEEMAELMNKKVAKSKDSNTKKGTTSIKNKVPKLDLSFKSKEESEQSQKKPKVPQLDLQKVEKHKDYHDEFMEREQEFSPSWRDQLEREKRF